MKRIFLALALSSMVAACGEDSVKQAIEANGFTEVQIVPGVVFWGCDQKDNVMYNTSFKALAQNGKHVEGVACGGILKGWTVRIEKVS